MILRDRRVRRIGRGVEVEVETEVEVMLLIDGRE